MAAEISHAVQNGTKVTVYDKNNFILFSVGGQLMGYTSSSVSVKNGNKITIFNSNGHTVSSVAVVK